MNIGISWNSRTSGGGQVFLVNLATALAAEPSCSSVTIFVTGPELQAVLPARVTVVHVSRSSARVAGRLVGGRRLRAALRSHPVDVILCPGTAAVSVPGVPTVMWPLTVAPFEPEALRVLAPSLVSRVRWTLLRLSIAVACRRADALVFSSNYARSLHTHAVATLARTPCTVIGPAASLEDRIEAGPSAEPEIADSGYLLFVSHLYPYKMVVEMIEALAISSRDPGFIHELRIAGSAADARYHDEIKTTITRLGLTNRVELLGAVDQATLDQLYRGAWAFVFPSISENAGSYALIDAFAYGLPVLCSSRSSMPEVCDGAARLFDPYDPSSLAAALTDLNSNPNLVASLADGSSRRSVSTPTWAGIARAFVTFVDGLDGVRRDEGGGQCRST